LKKAEVIKLDARELNHPEPLERSRLKFLQLDDDNCFHLIIRRLPKPLLVIAKNQNILFEYKQVNENEWHVVFTKNQNLNLKEILEELVNV